MRKGKLYIGIALLLATIFAGSGFALDNPLSSYLPIHFVKVSVNDSDPASADGVANRQVVLYKDDLSKAIIKLSDPDGNVTYNAYRLKHFFGEGIDSISDYRVGVYKGGADNYGAFAKKFKLNLSQGFTEVAVTLAAGESPDDAEKGKITGLITDADTKLAIEGAEVTRGVSGDTSGPGGSYTLADVPAGQYQVHASKKDYISNSSPATVAAGETTNIDIELTPLSDNKAEIHGYVYDGGAEGPKLVGAKVEVVNGDSVLTGADGWYQVLVDGNQNSYILTASLLEEDFPPQEQEVLVLVGASVKQDFYLIKEVPPSDLAFTIEEGTNLVAATLNVPYEFELVSGGTKPYSLQNVPALPSDLAFDPLTGQIKGTPLVTGPFGFTIKVQDAGGAEIEGNFSIVVAEVPVPDGTVLLGISRNTDNNIDITWTAPTPPEILYLGKTEDQEYNNSDGWIPLDPNNLPDGVSYDTDDPNAATKLTWSDAAHSAYKALYFKGLVGGFGGGPGLLASAHPVGKLDYVFAVDDLKLMVVPLTVGSAQDAVAGQVPDGVIKLYPRIGGGINVNQYSNAGGWVAGDFTISPTVGFWLRNSTGAELTLTFVGVLPLVDYEETLQPLDLTGNPLPMPLTFDAGQGEVGDKIYPQAGKGLSVFERVAAGWQGGDKNIVLGQGFWYRSGDGTARKWEIKPKDGTAILKK